MDITELKRSEGKTNRHPWEIARSRIISFLLKKTEERFRHIVDFGSGDVYVLNQLVQQKKADQYSAIDTAYDQELISNLDNASGQIRFFSSQNEFEAGQPQADLALFLDVLEHCENDHEVLQKAVHSPVFHGSPSHTLITIPAFQSLFSQHDKLLAHYRRYNRKKLLGLCKEAGLKPLQSGYFFFSLLPFRLIQLTGEKLGIRKTKKTIDNWQGGNFITRCITQILWIDFRICYMLSNWGIQLPGLSCYCLCQKSH